MSLQTTNFTTNITAPSCPSSLVSPLGITGHLCAVPLCSNNTAIMRSCCNGNPVLEYTYPGINEGNKTYQGLYCFLNGTMGNLTTDYFIDCVDELGFGTVMGCDEGKYTDKKGAGQRVEVGGWTGVVGRFVLVGLLVSGLVNL